jgi:apolipoprotein N-acyltransferase
MSLQPVLSPRLRWGFLGLALLVTVVSGWQMLRMPLWGYWPLPFMLGVWGMLLSLLAGRMLRQADDLRHLGLATLSGVLLWLGFPDMPFTPLIFMAFIPLLLVEEDQQLRYGRRSLVRVGFYAFHAFFLWNVLSTFWVANTAFVAGIFANWVNSLLMTIPLLAYHWLRHTARDRFRWASLMVFWMMFEFNHLNWDLTWPFLSLGNALAQYPSWVQWYSYTGMLGGTVWILLVQILLYPGVLCGYRGQGWRKAAFWPGVLAFALPLAISLGIWFTWQEEGTPVEVAIVQPNFEPHYEKFNLSQQAQQDRFLSLSREVLGPDTRYLVFPETAFGGFDLKGLEERPEMRALRALLDSFPECALITGVDPYRFLEQGEDSPAKRPYLRGPADTLWWEASNMAIQFGAGQPVQTYLKGKLVPGAEIFPYRWLFFFMEPLVDQLGGSLQGLRRSEQRKAFVHPEGHRVGPVICYESVFGEYSNGYIREGAQALAIITNDGWWDDTPGHRQHLAIGTLRAIETRREIMRSANTGISCLINQRGQVRQATRYEEAASFRGTLMLRDGLTFYARWGDYLGRMGGGLALILMLYGLVASMRRWLDARR